ncbi:MAG: hypothetical protein K0Q79_2336 [Flavipsychrobacter sp.]|nr:hypothetical protein [Flavipsychrobacter sp.]
MKQLFQKLALLVCVFWGGTSTHAQYITTVAGMGYMTGYTGDGGPATVATMYSPSDIAFDQAGNLYITDFINNVIRKLDTNGYIYTVAGTGFGAGSAAAGAYTGDGGPATAADLNGPFAIAIDASGNIIFADGYNHVVRKVSTSGIITTIAGKPTAGYSGDGGPATAAELNNPVGLAIDAAGNLYIADNHNNVIRMVNTAGIISTVIGNGTPAFSGDGGPATAASMDLPIGIAFDTAENMYIADVRNNKIRRVDKITGIITTVAGTDSAGYTGDGGPATAARLDTAERIDFDDSNNLYISDFFNNVVRKVDAVTGIITTIAGNGYGAGSKGMVHNFCGDDSLATAACLYLPYGVKFDSHHRMYICDRGNHAIRRVGPPAPPPPIDHSSVQDMNKSHGMAIQPNPAQNGTVTINMRSAANEEVTITIFNILGETVHTSSTITNTPYTLQLNIPPGMYIVSGISASGKWHGRMVVE